MEVEKLFEIEGSSQEFIQPPQLVRVGKNMVVKYDYENENGEYGLKAITFTDVIACTITKEVCRELYMIKAYDSVNIVKDSSWVSKMKNTYKGDAIFNYEHYVIYFEDYGCYEFIASKAYNGI